MIADGKLWGTWRAWQLGNLATWQGLEDSPSLSLAYIILYVTALLFDEKNSVDLDGNLPDKQSGR